MDTKEFVKRVLNVIFFICLEWYAWLADEFDQVLRSSTKGIQFLGSLAIFPFSCVMYHCTTQLPFEEPLTRFLNALMFIWLTWEVKRSEEGEAFKFRFSYCALCGPGHLVWVHFMKFANSYLEYFILHFLFTCSQVICPFWEIRLFKLIHLPFMNVGERRRALRYQGDQQLRLEEEKKDDLSHLPGHFQNVLREGELNDLISQAIEKKVNQVLSERGLSIEERISATGGRSQTSDVQRPQTEEKEESAFEESPRRLEEDYMPPYYYAQGA